MKKKNPEAKLVIKKQAWLERTSLVLGTSNDETLALINTPRTQSVRHRSGVKPKYLGTEFGWAHDCYELTKTVAEIRDDPAVRNGTVYIQNAASWLPVILLEPNQSDTILDICAAPGGKTSHIRDIAGPSAEIWANDNSRARMAKLQANMNQLNVHIDNYTLFDAVQLAKKIENKQFTKILLDAPCSGEGMMLYSKDKDFASWSVAHIKRLQQLQKKIIGQAWQLLAPGGTLVYSTCTMAPEENEAVIDYLLRSQENVQVEAIELQLDNRVATVQEWNGRPFNSEVTKAMRLKPSKHIEAFFVCKLTKA